MIDGPEDCPTPIFHETHRYCLSCSWTEVPISPDSSLREQIQDAIHDAGDWLGSAKDIRITDRVWPIISAGLAAARADEREKTKAECIKAVEMRWSPGTRDSREAVRVINEWVRVQTDG